MIEKKKKSKLLGFIIFIIIAGVFAFLIWQKFENSDVYILDIPKIKYLLFPIQMFPL